MHKTSRNYIKKFIYFPVLSKIKFKKGRDELSYQKKDITRV